MQWDDAGDGAGLPETGERDAVQGTEPGAERHAAEYKAVALGDAVIGSAAGASGDVPGTDVADDAVAADAAGAADTASLAGEAVSAGVDTPAVDEAATSVIGNVPVPTAAEGKTETAAQEGAGAAGQQAADDEGMQFLDNPAWDIPDVMFPSMGGVKDASSGRGPSYGASSPHVPLPEPEDTVRPVHVSASDPLGLEDVSDIPAVPEEEEPQGNNDVTMVIQPLSAFPTPTQSVRPTAGMTPQTVPLPPEAGAAVPPHGSGEPGGKADGSSRKQHGHRRAIIIAVVAVVVVALAATGGFLWWRHVQNQNELDQAASLCEASKTKADKAFSELQSALSEAKPAQQIPQGDVSDPTVLETLNSAVTKASSASEPVSCDVALGAETLNANASKNKQIARASTKAKMNVAKATKAVNDGKAEKVEFIKHELQTAVTGAQKIYDDSKGVVLDDSTRTTLQSAIDQANALLQQDDAALNEMQRSITDVKDAGDAVTVSMNEYTAQQKYLEQQRQQEKQQQQQQDDQNDNGDDLNGSTDSQIGDSRGHETQPTHPQGSDD